MADKLRWGILATGRIAAAFARSLRASRTGELVAVASRSQDVAERFGEQHGATHRWGAYEALLADEDVDAVYVATPHPMHAEWTVRAAEAGKHILCEKPLTMNLAQAEAVVAAARRNDVFLMEAFMYRCHPQTEKLVELLRAQAIGRVTLIQASLGFRARFDPAGRIFNKNLGGGAILDTGCYPASLVRLVAGVAQDLTFADPTDLWAQGRLHPDLGVDEWSAALLSFSGDLCAQVATAISSRADNMVRIFGTQGQLVIPEPWLHSQQGKGGQSQILLTRGSHDTHEITIESPRNALAVEADVVAANLERREAPFPAMTWEDSLGNMRVLDQWRRAIGLVYDADRPGTT